MKKNKRNWVYPFIVMGVFLLLLSNCRNDYKEDDEVFDEPLPEILHGLDVTDIDGNVYHTVIIGTQEWMVENLKTTKYRNGDTIPEVTGNTAWINLNTGAYCVYETEDKNAQIETYGRLYNYYAVTDPRHIAPEGWHIPSITEWETLINFLGGESVAGGKMKEAGLAHWKIPNEGADNSSGFTALPGSWRENGRFEPPLGIAGLWWSSTMKDDKSQWTLCLTSGFGMALTGPGSLSYGLSVRCVKD